MTLVQSCHAIRSTILSMQWNTVEIDIIYHVEVHVNWPGVKNEIA